MIHPLDGPTRVRKSFARTEPLRGDSLNGRWRGETTATPGPSGSGESTRPAQPRAGSWGPSRREGRRTTSSDLDRLREADRTSAARREIGDRAPVRRSWRRSGARYGTSACRSCSSGTTGPRLPDGRALRPERLGGRTSPTRCRASPGGEFPPRRGRPCARARIPEVVLRGGAHGRDRQVEGDPFPEQLRRIQGHRCDARHGHPREPGGGAWRTARSCCGTAR